MNTKKFSKALGNISESYINESVSYTAKKKATPWVKWVAVAACFCIAVMGLFPFFGNHESPFVLTAYALGEDNSLQALEMEEGQAVPISTFVAGNGMEGFVFSHKNRESEQALLGSIIITDTDFSPYIMSDSYTSTTTVEKIERIDLEKTLQYIFVVPAQGEAAPYSLTISMYDEETSVAAELNAEYDYKLCIPENRKYSVYDAYKDLTPEEFEKQILEELKSTEEHFEGNGEMNFDVVFPDADDYYKIDRTGVTEVTGTSQMSDPVAKVVLTGTDAENFLKQIDELCLQHTGTSDNTKGWEYFFVVKYDDGGTTSITLAEKKIDIDGKVYKTSLYKSDDFAMYFE